MEDLYTTLRKEFEDPDYRYAYAESFLNNKLAAQIKTLRSQRELTQSQVATAMGIKQPGYRRFEDSNHSVWKTDSLWNIARALGVRLDVSFKSFGSLPEDRARLSKKTLQVTPFEKDKAFWPEEKVSPEAAEERTAIQPNLNGQSDDSIRPKPPATEQISSHMVSDPNQRAQINDPINPAGEPSEDGLLDRNESGQLPVREDGIHLVYKRDDKKRDLRDRRNRTANRKVRYGGYRT